MGPRLTWSGVGWTDRRRTHAQYLIGGIAEIDVDDWQKSATYKNCNANDLLVRWFWQVRIRAGCGAGSGAGAGRAQGRA